MAANQRMSKKNPQLGQERVSISKGYHYTPPREGERSLQACLQRVTGAVRRMERGVDADVRSRPAICSTCVEIGDRADPILSKLYRIDAIATRYDLSFFR